MEGAAAGPHRTAEEVGELVRAVEDRAASSGFDLARLEGYAIGSGIVVATIRYGEAEFAHGPTDWYSRLAPDVWDEGREYTAFVDIRLPEQEPLEAARARGATHLVFSVSVLLNAGGLGARLQEVVLDCDGGESEAVVDPGALCDRVIADRYDLLPLLSSDFMCAGNPNDTAWVTGTLVGEPFERGYDHCDGYAHTLEELLGIRRLAPAAPAACLDAWNASADRRTEAVAERWPDVRIAIGTATSGGTEVAACEYVLGSTRPMRFEAPLVDDTAGPVGVGSESQIRPNVALPRSATVDGEGRLVAIAPSARTLDDCVAAWNFAGVGADAGFGINSYEGKLAATVAGRTATARAPSSSTGAGSPAAGTPRACAGPTRSRSPRCGPRPTPSSPAATCAYDPPAAERARGRATGLVNADGARRHRRQLFGVRPALPVATKERRAWSPERRAG